MQDIQKSHHRRGVLGYWFTGFGCGLARQAYHEKVHVTRDIGNILRTGVDAISRELSKLSREQGVVLVSVRAGDSSHPEILALLAGFLKLL